MRALRVTLAATVIVALLGGATPMTAESDDADAAGTFAPAGSLAEGRNEHTTTLMPDGRLLIIGGSDVYDESLDTAVLWDPATGSSTPTGSLAKGRHGHTATLLPDERVLVVGGWSDDSSFLSVESHLTAEVWDPARGSFTPAGSLCEGRDFHTATLLPDGRVLVVGGWVSQPRPLATTEVWDPVTGSFTPAGSLAGGRASHTATLLADGRVLVAGGTSLDKRGVQYVTLASAEVWDLATASFAPAGSFTEGREHHTATLLPDGRVLVLGGWDANVEHTTTVEAWSPAE